MKTVVFVLSFFLSLHSFAKEVDSKENCVNELNEPTQQLSYGIIKKPLSAGDKAIYLLESYSGEYNYTFTTRVQVRVLKVFPRHFVDAPPAVDVVYFHKLIPHFVNLDASELIREVPSKELNDNYTGPKIGQEVRFKHQELGEWGLKYAYIGGGKVLKVYENNHVLIKFKLRPFETVMILKPINELEY